MYKILIFSISFLSILFSTNNVLAQQQRNVKSSCRLYTTAGLVEKGKCIIKTYIQGDYIIAEVYKSWEKSNEPTKLRFTNRSDCTSWQWKSENGCAVELWDGGEGGYVSTVENEENGRKRFIYSLGNAYVVEYDGPFPHPK